MRDTHTGDDRRILEDDRCVREVVEQSRSRAEQHGSQIDLDLVEQPGRSRFSSFPRAAFGWVNVQKTRRIRSYSLDGHPILAAGIAADEGACAVELTDVTLGRDRWWTLGFEATGPSEELAAAVKWHSCSTIPCRED